MRRTLQLLARAQPEKYLTPYAPTGLTGLATHPSPRPALISIYKQTLDKLKAFPESSLYRQSTENLTKHRLSIIDAVKPEGYDAWLSQYKTQLEKQEAAVQQSKASVSNERAQLEQAKAQLAEKTSNNATAKRQIETLEEKIKALDNPEVAVEVNSLEPPLTAEQIAGLENKLGAGLIEEVIQVAEGELKLIDTLAEAKIWEDLEEKPVEGQWKYFERTSHA